MEQNYKYKIVIYVIIAIFITGLSISIGYDKKIEKLNNEIDSKETTISYKEEKLEEQKEIIDDLRNKIKEKDSEIYDLKNSHTSSSSLVVVPDTNDNDEITSDYVLNKNTKVFHYPYCSSVNQMKDSNKKEMKATRDEMISKGYKPCGRCNP